jgi:uncharacterized membrane protein YidH (DUF202 family)
MTDLPAVPATPPAEQQAVRRRQLSNARITAWLLTAFVVLTFAITIAKISVSH